MNEFLRTKKQIDDSTKWLKDNGYISHGISAKDWELKTVIENIGDGNLLDMGSDGSYVLENSVKKGIQGRKVGVDLAYKFNSMELDGVKLLKADLMNTGFPDNEFSTIVSLSTIEHQVDFEKFAKECARLLKREGNVIVSFDYFDPKPNTESMKLYSLDWNILDKKDAIRLIKEFNENGLELSGEVDWTLQDAVINPTYCSPAQGVSYSFGIFQFINK